MERKKLYKVDKKNKKRLLVSMIASFFLLFLLIFRIGFIQFVQGASLKERANNQQTSTRVIYAERGTIFDANGKVLAISADVDTVSINPAEIKYTDKSDVNKEFLFHSCF